MKTFERFVDLAFSFLILVLMALATALLAMFVWALFLQLPARAAERVDVALVLAVDHSSSVDAAEWKLQLEGYAAAFRSPQVKASIASGYNQRIAVTMFRWSDYSLQETLIGWTVLRSPEDADMFAAQILQFSKLPWLNGTCIAGALTFANELLNQLPANAERLVIDVSGDEAESCGPNGPYARQIRDELVNNGIQINGLPILSATIPEYSFGVPIGGDPNENTERFYREQVIGGPGAFLVVAEGFQGFAAAVQRKLLLEIAMR
jgi:hypothetical protein